MLTIAGFLDYQCEINADAAAIVDANGGVTYGVLHALASRVAGGLHARGVRRGDHVAICCPNTVAFVAALFGVAKLGCVAVPINLMLKRRDMAFQLNQTGATAFFCCAGTPDMPVHEEGWSAFNDAPACRLFVQIGEMPPTNGTGDDRTVRWDALLASGANQFESVAMSPEDPAVIIYSSGTTGRPRGAINTVSSIVVNTYAVAECAQMCADDRALVTVPLFAGYARGALLFPAMLTGGALVLMPRYDPVATIAKIAEHRISVFAGVPAMYWDMVENSERSGVDVNSLSSHWRLAWSAGAPLPSALKRRFEEKFKVPLRQMLGMAEARIIASDRADTLPRDGSTGRAIWGTEIRVVDPQMNPLPGGEKGEIVVRGPSTMPGYLNDAENTQLAFHEGWLRTGDIGYLDKEKYLYVVDRSRDVILRGGYNVYPREIEDVLGEHPATALVSVIGVPDDRMGEEVTAFVTLVPGAQCSSEELVAWAKEQLPRHVCPRTVEIRDTLPKGPTGKILKEELRKIVAAR